MAGITRVLFGGAIDYAGLFPPASLAMPEAVANYVRYRDGEHSWLLGRVVVPSARWAEFHAEAEQQSGRWRVAITGDPIRHDWVEAVESPSAEAAPGVEVYREVPIDAEVEGLGVRAKVRTGGIDPSAFPSSAALAGFVQRCHRTRTPFKATAGLHHALRGDYRLTPESTSRCARMHGFVNLTMAAVFPASAEAILEETDPHAFEFAHDHVRWRGLTAGLDEVRAARELFVSFGSCSFDEPAAELGALGWL